MRARQSVGDAIAPFDILLPAAARFSRVAGGVSQLLPEQSPIVSPRTMQVIIQ
jgi:hypothetical protein